ncbi:MAG: HDIG domain-containing metalloprotein [Eubacteriales bacterium]
MNRDKAFEILCEHVETASLQRHCFAVEAAMRAYAEHFGEDVERWGTIGLLHDVDFEKYPDVHPNKAPELLEGYGFDQDFIDTIVSHGIGKEDMRSTQVRKCLFAVDKMASFIVAVALMRPTKLEGLEAKSVKKKIKDKAFAKAVDRDELQASMEDLGMEMSEHVSIIVKGLTEQEEMLQKQGYSLLG